MKTKIKLLSDRLHQQVLGRTPHKPSKREMQVMQQSYERAGLQDAEDNSLDVEIPIPSDVGTIYQVTDEACEMLGLSKYLKNLDILAEANLIKPSAKIPVKAGWQMWNGVRWVESSRPPNGSTMVADFETVQHKNGKWYPTMLVCLVVDYGCYVWQWESWLEPVTTVSIGNNQTIIGHNIPYDRSYFTEEYLIADSGNRYFDTMAAFIAVRGMSNQQRPLYKMRIDLPWKRETTTNGLGAIHHFYTGVGVDKTFRDAMVKMSPEQVMDNMSQALQYCLEDVYSTWQVFRYVYAEWLIAQPHKLSRAGQMMLGNIWLPVSTERFPQYETNAASKYEESMDKVREGIALAYKLFCDTYFKVNHEGRALETPYIDLLPDKIPQELQYLDWTPAKVGKTKGLPKWYRETKIEEITLHSRIVVTIFKLKYMGEYLYWEAHPTLKTDKGNAREGWRTETEFIPNVEDAEKTVSYIFSDKLVKLGEDGILSTDVVELKDIFDLAISCVNWVGLRKRVSVIRTESPEGFPVVVPSICVTGTLTRRMADSTWQCAPNAKVKRIGTELKSMIEVPKGYKMVGADVDGQEAWIASLMADYMLGFCGGSAFGLTMLVGQKKYKTDVHSVISAQAGIGRTLAKNIFYGMLYGLALKGVKEYIAKSNASLSRAEVQAMAEGLIRKVKGIKINGRWVDGLASDAFNYMESLVSKPQPRSTVLKAALTKALAGCKDFQTSKVNWTIQTSGVDFRDALLVFNAYFFRKLGVNPKLLMTIHDEVRYMVLDDEVTNTAHALQLGHLYTRALFIDAFELDGIPQACAYFSGVDIDTVWRKASVPEYDKNGYDEANAACITPSQTGIFEYGKVLEPIDIYNQVK